MEKKVKYNVLLITADQLRFDAISPYGNEFVKTPNLEKLAKEGVIFENAYTTNPICVPARASITTGNYSHKATGRKSNSGKIKDGQNKIAEHFKRYGYSTYAIGKLHYVPYSPPDKPRLLHGFEYAELTEEGRILNLFDPEGKKEGLEDYHDYLKKVGWVGFDRAHGTGNNDVHPVVSPLPKKHYVDVWVAERTKKVIEKHIKINRNKPFFIWMSFPKPHSPYDPPFPYNRLYNPKEIPEPVGNLELLKYKNPYLYDRHFKYGWDKISPATVKVAKAHYHALVSLQDEMIGKVIKFLKEKGIFEKTIIIFTSDHGDLLGDFGIFFKSCFLEGSVRIPLLLYVPQKKFKNKKVKNFAGLHDILPTLSYFTGTPLEYPVDGENLMNFIDGKGREFIVSQTGESPDQSYMVRKGEWKYIYNEVEGIEELYNLEEDPYELKNLVQTGKYKGLLKKMRETLIEWCIENEDGKILEKGKLKKSKYKEDRNFNPNLLGSRWF
ncbi:sulfatase-like hydrolase/transferase [bacterium]|nr:sulfatase-like hydrolase/transferase [bacterium]